MERTITRDIDPLSFPEKKTPPPPLLPQQSPRPAPVHAGRQVEQEGVSRGGDREIMLCTSHSFSFLAGAASSFFFFCWRCICFIAIQIMLTQGASLALDHQNNSGKETSAKMKNGDGKTGLNGFKKNPKK